MVDVIKRLAADVLESEALAEISIGVVRKEEPLTIGLESGLEIPERFLKKTAAVVDETEEGSMTFKGESGSFSILHKKGLKTGEQVVLARTQGGQRYIILDRVKEG